MGVNILIKSSVFMDYGNEYIIMYDIIIVKVSALVIVWLVFVEV